MSFREGEGVTSNCEFEYLCEARYLNPCTQEAGQERFCDTRLLIIEAGKDFAEKMKKAVKESYLYRHLDSRQEDILFAIIDNTLKGED